MSAADGMTEDAYRTAVATAVDLVRSHYPTLDLRAGTAIRSLVVEPAATLDALHRSEIARLRASMSLDAMRQQGAVDTEAANAILSNFGMELGTGKPATGLVRVTVQSQSPVTVRSGVVFSATDGMTFVSTATVSASAIPSSDEKPLVAAEDGTFYFTVPVEAEQAGTAGNIRRGTALSASVLLGRFVSSEAFSDFTGGEDVESLDAAISRIPAALAYRGMTNAFSVRACLSDALEDPSTLRALSCVGQGSRAQLRDKHNLFGVAVGGRTDVYARLFGHPETVSFTAAGARCTRDGRECYRIDIPGYPGFYAVRYVGRADQPNSPGTLRTELVRGIADGASAVHDISAGLGGSEGAWSAYQTGTVFVYDVPVGGDYLGEYTEESEGESTASILFNVELYWSPGIDRLQAVVDSPDKCNVAADYVVRSPAICLVSVSARVALRPGGPGTSAELENAVANYINSRSFVGRLSRSEISSVLLQSGAESVDLGVGGMHLSGRVCGADGAWYHMSGDALDVSGIGPDAAMLTQDTVVFGAEPQAIQVIVA